MGRELRRTRRAVEAHDRYVRDADRDRWLVEHPGIPFPASMLTDKEHRDEDRIRRLRAAPWTEVRTRLIAGWVAVAVTAFFLSAGVGGAIIFIAAAVTMAGYHHSERKLWHELHTPTPQRLAAPLPPEQAAQIVAQWEPPAGHGRAV